MTDSALAPFGIVEVLRPMGDYTEFRLWCGCLVRVSGHEAATSSRDPAVPSGLFELLVQRLREHETECPVFSCPDRMWREVFPDHGIVGQRAVTGDSVTFALCCGCALPVTGHDVRHAYDSRQPEALMDLLRDRLARHEDECAIYATALAVLRAGRCS